VALNTINQIKSIKTKSVTKKKAFVLSDYCLTSIQQFVHLYHVANTLVIDKMMMRSALYWTNTLSWIVIVLAH